MPTTATRPQLSYLTDQMNELRQKGTHLLCVCWKSRKCRNVFLTASA